MANVMDIASIKIIKSKRQIKNRYIGNFMFMSFASGVFCILYSVLHVASFMWFSGPTPSNGPPLPPSPSPFVQNNLEINSDVKSAQDTLPVHTGSKLSWGLKHPDVFWFDPVVFLPRGLLPLWEIITQEISGISDFPEVLTNLSKNREMRHNGCIPGIWAKNRLKLRTPTGQDRSLSKIVIPDFMEVVKF
jgi:hypothetical protein